MADNYFRFPLSKMLKYVQLFEVSGGVVPWGEILQLHERKPISLIEVIDDSDNRIVLVHQGLHWDGKTKELKLQMIEVSESLQKLGIGTTVLNMVIAIGVFYGAPKITGTIVGKPFLWDWYPKLGFTIHDGNKLLMELNR